MNIREISDVFKDTASNITALKSYNFGWASDRVRHGNTEDYQDLNAFPRLFFSVPTITSSDQTRKQDTYQVTLFFDDLLGYDNDGDSDLTLQIDKWALLQNYATAFIQRLNLIKQSILPNYLFIPEAPSFTFDSFVGIQRLVTVQVNFNLVVPTNCEVTVQRIINVVGNVLASGVASGNLFRSTSVTGTATATASVFANLTVGQNIVELFAEVFANGNVTANITRALNLNANVVTDSTVNANPTIALNLTGNSTATGDVNALPTIIKNLTATATTQASINAALTVTTQGIASVDAFVTATGSVTADILRIATLESSSNTTADTTANATLTKVLEANASATAQTSSDAQLTLAVNASASATAITTADASLSYTVNTEANATAQTNADAFITRIISAEATATANSSAEAGIGVTFVAAAVGVATSTNADLFRTATMVGSVTGSANITGATLTTVDNVAASASGAATVNATLDVASPFILDLYGNAAAAYSVRKLRSAYTGSALRVRRSSDNTEQDIGFSNNNLDESALISFVGANNGFVVTWYDQTGNARNATISTAANQPQIVSSGTVIKVNNKPALSFDSVNDILTVPTSTAAFKFLHDGTKSFVLNVLKYNNSGQKPLFGNNSGTTAQTGISVWKVSSNSIKIICTNSSSTEASSPIAYTSSSVIVTNSQTLLSIELDASNGTLADRAKIYFNNGSANTGNTSNGTPSTNNASQNFQLSSFGDGGGGMDGNLQESIFWSIDQSANRTNIQSNVNTYYAIY